jgi:hypothetical protein
MRLRERLMQELVARLNQLHRLVDLGFPEFTHYLKDLKELATAILVSIPLHKPCAESRASIWRNSATTAATNRGRMSRTQALG